MKIKRLDVYHIRIPLIAPWRTAYGIEDAVESIVIKAYSDTETAWVETCPLSQPLYSPESAKSAYHNIIDSFAPIIIGKYLENGNSIPSLLDLFQGNRFAKAGVEQCWWALTAIRQEIPLHRLISGNGMEINNEVKVRSAFGIMDSAAALLKNISDGVNSGIIDIKLKIKQGWDFDVLKHVVNEFPNLNITVDCNGGFTLEDLDFFKEIDCYGLAMIEQPLAYHDLYNHALLQNEINTPICLDESISCIADVEHAVMLTSCRIVNIKIGRVGGISQAIKIHDICQKNGLSCLVGGMMESGIGTRFNIELAAALNISHANGITLPPNYHSIELTKPPISCSKAGMIENDKCFSFEVDEDMLESITVSKQMLK